MRLYLQQYGGAGHEHRRCFTSHSSSNSGRRQQQATLRRREPVRSRQLARVLCSGDKYALAANDALPLSDMRVMVTAPRQYATKLTTKLLAAGARPLWLPTIQIAELRDTKDQQVLLDSLRDLKQYDHLGFSSKNGIVAVLAALEGWLGSRQAAVAHIEESGIKCWALGADAEELHKAGVRVVHRPEEPSTQGLVAELVRRGEAAGQRVLCPVPKVRTPLVEPEVVPRFLAALEQAGADAVRVDAYETAVGCKPASCSAEWELLMEGEVHAIAFSSTAEAQGLVQLMGRPRYVHRAVRMHDVLLAAHGPYTAAGAANVLGVPVTCVSRDSSTFDGLVDALAEALRGRVAQGPHCEWIEPEQRRREAAAREVLGS